MKNFQKEGLRIDIEEQGDTVVLHWLGKSDFREPGKVVTPYLDELINFLKEHAVILDFSKLDYMGSSTIMTLIQFLKNLNANQIKTVLKYNMQIEWQSASFKAFEMFSTTLEYLTVKGE